MSNPLLRVFCLMLEINEFRCYKAKIEESEKAGSLPVTAGLKVSLSSTFAS